MDDSAGRFQRLAATAVACAAFVAPANARAADVPTADQLIQNVSTTLAAAGVPAPAAPALARPIVDTNAIVRQTLSTVSSAAPTPSSTPVPAATQIIAKSFDAVSPAPHSHAKPVTTRHARLHAHVRRTTSVARASASVTSSAVTSDGLSVTRAALTAATSVKETASARIHRARGATSARQVPAGGEPQRPLPAPLPSRPDAASPAQGGGQGFVTPLVLGVLAAVLLLFVFELLPRALPPPALRKPRRIAFPPWRPG